MRQTGVRETTKSEYVSLSGETNHTNDEASWYLDIGCSNHMTGRRDWLLDLDTSIKSIVRFADDSIIKPEGSSKVLITRKDEKVVYMHNLLYVPMMKNNLLSLGQLLEKRYTMNLQQRHVEVFNEKQRLVLKAPLT
ncbi:uncharacterized protein LOC106778730 [Vigna radiata var. radiata]|uniref:Uncharacterized protein LOC106778730 n=1 Tax=Vigna radiata var. radiata TaxID=3916 RepID=A0A1S3VVW4_VIGRR|nr:uncharacterized protein LOC106778730 [Vigna radiata var. radiata]